AVVAGVAVVEAVLDRHVKERKALVNASCNTMPTLFAVLIVTRRIKRKKKHSDTLWKKPC
ncbi:7597_t:CDS:2, partial [Dentiscutata heterogama]